MEGKEIEGEEIGGEEIDEEETEEEFYETIKILSMVIQTIIIVLRETMLMVPRHLLNRRPVTRKGYNYIHNVLKEDPQSFRELHRMYPDVFLKLCTIIRDTTQLQDTRYICVEEMLATFLLVVGHNDRYCNVRQRFSRSHFTASRNFNKVLKALNTIAPQMMVKPGSAIPSKIRESTRFFKNKNRSENSKNRSAIIGTDS
ncbi:hypothetical protein LguiB_028148 [Lonicera macranthoides]